METFDDVSTYCTFFSGGLWFGLEVRQVQEVVRSLSFTTVPLSSPDIRGLANIRGQIITAIDLRGRLDLPGTDGEEVGQPINVVVRTERGPVSLLVDRIGDVVAVSGSDVEAPPDTLKGKVRDHLTGVAKLGLGLLLLLDPVSVVAEDDR